MSYILDALKKSEQERRIGAVPDLSMTQAPARAVPRWPRWLLGALLLNAVILLAVGWHVWGGRQDAQRSAAPVALPAPATVDVPPTSTPATAAANAAPVAPPVNSAPSPSPEPVSGSATTALSAEPVLETVSPESEQAVLGPDLEPLPESAPEEPSAIVAVDAPLWEDLPAAERDGLPVPRIDVHVFASEPERRFVLINLHKYLEGDTLDSGAVIETILADGIVLSYQGQHYRVDRP